MPARVGLLVLGALLAWQGWMTLTLFAPPPQGENREPENAGLRRAVRSAWARLRSDEPITSGQHPLHLYFGYLGAGALADDSTACCFDPAFQAGYPKTPVFDSGSRPAELFLYLAGGRYSPAAYKAGVAACCCSVPLLLALAAAGLRLGWGPCCLTVALGQLVWWATPCREALEDGDLDWLMAALAGLAYVCLLVDFDRRPGVGNWLGLVATGAVGWFANPFYCLLLVPLVVVYYVSTGTRHRLGWHAALLGSYLASLGINAFWLVDWARYWWIRLPTHFAAATLKHRTFQTFWTADLWGASQDRALGTALFLLAAAGVVLLNRSRQRPAARLLGLGAGGFLLLAAVGAGWQPLGRMGSASLVSPALWFAVPAAVFALAQAFVRAARLTGGTWRACGVVGALLLAAGAWGGRATAHWLSHRFHSAPFQTGLTRQQQELVQSLRSHSSPEARVLWEDIPGRRRASRWTALLPLLTDRAYIGGLSPDCCIEHAQAGFVDFTLAGRPVADWSDAELDDYCRRYNIGAAVCWSPTVVDRFRAWKGEGAAVPVSDGGAGYLFVLQPRSFVLKGQARWIGADRRHIALADVVPEDGVVVLSLHYQAGLQASPVRVQVDREPDPFDPIPFVRLRVPGPVALVTLTWDDR